MWHMYNEKVYFKDEHVKVTDLWITCHHITVPIDKIDAVKVDFKICRMAAAFTVFVLFLILVPAVCCFFDCPSEWLGIIFLPLIFIWLRMCMDLTVQRKHILTFIFAVFMIFTGADSFAYTAADLLSAAAKGELEKVVKILKQQNATSKKGGVAKGENVNVDCKGDDGRTPLMVASYWGRIDVVKNLVENKANINAVDLNGVNALSLAAAGRKNDVCQYLIKQKADVNIKDTYGQNALFRAIQCDNTEIISLILDAGADVNVQDNGGNTPLIFAVQKKQNAIVESLIKKGADVNKKNKRDKTAMDYAGNNIKLKTLLSTDKAELKK